jgi:hypothetical protein
MGAIDSAKGVKEVGKKVLMGGLRGRERERERAPSPSFETLKKKKYHAPLFFFPILQRGFFF